MADSPSDDAHGTAPLRSPFRLGPWLVEPDLNRIAAEGREVAIIPRNMKVLCVLAGRAGRVVLRDELLESVWPDVVVNEEVLTSAVSELRSALGDTPQHSRYIQTIRKKGYRLLLPATPVTEAELPGTVSPGTAPPGNVAAGNAAAATAPVAPAPNPRPLRWQAVLLLTLVAAAALALWTAGRDSRAPRRWECRPLTSAVGEETCPSLSPDGAWVAYARRRAGEPNAQLVVRSLGDEAELALTSGPGVVTYSTWSPDGGRLAFCRARGDSSVLGLVPALGGETTRLAALFGPVRGLDWSPDGRWLACARFDERFVMAIHLLDLQSRAWRTVTAPAIGSGGDGWPVFSPDGRRLAFARGDSSGWDDVCAVSPEGGEPRRLSRRPLQIVGLDWLPDGRHLVAAGGEGGPPQLWRLDAGSGRWERGPFGPELVIRPRAAARAPGLVAESLELEQDLFRVALEPAALSLGTAAAGTRAGAPGPSPEPLTALNSTRSDGDVACSPSDGRLAFVSRRGGDAQVYVGEADGARPPVPVTALERAQIWNLQWSPDERRLLFSAQREGQVGFYALDLETRQLSEPLPGAPLLSWPRLSRNGEWVYASVVADGRWEFVRIRAADGRRERILDSAARCLFDSPDADTLWCAPLLGARVYRWVAGGDKCVWEDAPPSARRVLRAATPRHIYGLDGEAASGALWRRDLASGAVDTLLHLDGRSCQSLSVEARGRWLYLSLETRRDHDLILVPDYR